MTGYDIMAQIWQSGNYESGEDRAISMFVTDDGIERVQFETDAKNDDGAGLSTTK